MKNASPELLALLATRQFYTTDLYAFTLIGGGMLRFASGNGDIHWDGQVWAAGGTTGPYFDRRSTKAKCHWKVGVEVDTLVFDVLPGSYTIDTQPLLSAVRTGLFDGAEMTLYRAFMPTYGNVAAGTVVMFAGRVAEVDAGRSLITFTINSHLELLNQNLPRNLYQPGCLNTLFDSACGLSAPSYQMTVTAGAGSTASLIATDFSKTAGYFNLGTAAFTSGVNAGLTRTIKRAMSGAGGSVALIAPFPAAPSAGDTLVLTAGCDKRQATCGQKFSNLARFRGFPYVPENATAV